MDKTNELCLKGLILEAVADPREFTINEILNYVEDLFEEYGRATINEVEASSREYWTEHGYDHGYEEGHRDGYEEGGMIGYDNGYEEGKDVGLEKGFEDGREEGYYEAKCSRSYD